MTSYAPLKQYLSSQTFAEIPMAFSDIARILGGSLPSSAYKHRPWWANEVRGHSQAKAWLEAGYETCQVDMAKRRLVFKRKLGGLPPSRGAHEMEESDRLFTHGEKTPRRSGLFGALKGTFTIEPGYDLTSPALDSKDWDTALTAMQAKFDKGHSNS